MAAPQILHVINTASVGGGGEHVYTLLEACPHSTSLLVGESGPLLARARRLGVPTHVVPFMGPRWDLRWAWRLARFVRAQQPDLVHLHGTRSAFLYNLARWVAPSLPPSIYTEHAFSHRQALPSWRKRLHLYAEWLATQWHERVVCVARGDREELLSRGWRAADSVRFIPNGVDIERFKGNAAARRRARRGLGIDTKALLVGVVARLVPQKAVDQAVHALSRALSADSRLRAVIVGDGPERDAIAREVERQSQSGKIQLLGGRSDVPELLAACDIYLLTSRWEGLPIGLLEAMAAARPVVATAAPGTRELVQHERNGLLAPVDAPEGIARAVLRAAADRKLRRRLGAAARRTVQQRYDKAHFVNATFRLYEEVLGSFPG